MHCYFTIAAFNWAALIVYTGLFALPNSAAGGGVVTNTSSASFLAAVAGGGTVSFAATGTVTLATTIVISKDTTLIDPNHAIVISGGTNTPIRLFIVNTNVQLTIVGLTLANGNNPNGGAIHNSGLLVMTDCTLSNNIASATSGSLGLNGSFGTVHGNEGKSGQPGNVASGGAIHNLGTAIIMQCTFVTNQVIGGVGGVGGSGGPSNYQGGDGGDGGKGGAGLGGAIYSVGVLQISNTFFSLNTARGGNGGAGGTNGLPSGASATGDGGSAGSAAGGAVYAAGVSSVMGSTFWGNSVTGGIPADAAANTSHFNGVEGKRGTDCFGGALYNVGTQTLVNCTFNANLAFASPGGKGGNGLPYSGDGGNGGDARGGNCYNEGTMDVSNCTFASGAAHPGTGGAPGSGAVAGEQGKPGRSLGDNIVNNEGVLILKNTILAYPATSVNTYGPIQDGLNNLSSDETPLSFPAERRGVNPLLLPLNYNGGPTLTMALSDASPAIDAGDCGNSPATDQRGYPRNGNCDVGAFELQEESSALPVLRATSIGRQLSVSWSMLATNYTLWSASDLTQPTGWQPAHDTVRSQLNSLNVTIEMTNQSQFFRLRSQ